jgi:O-acetyl-ADP-ribose deacetylase (regulator of RNase III)
VRLRLIRLPGTDWYVIHTVGPIWRGDNAEASARLSSCYRRSLEIAIETGIKTIAFPSISAGAFGYPIDKAAAIAVKTVRDFLEKNPVSIDVTFCCFSERDVSVYNRCLAELQS